MTPDAETIDLRVGDPGLPTPPAATAAAVEAMAAGLTHYTPAAGIPELREAAASKFRAQGLDCSADSTIIGCGAKSLLYALLLGDDLAGREVVIPAPHYAAYPALVRFAGGTPRVVSTRLEDGYKLTPEMLRHALTPQTRWLFLNTPANPTGATYTTDEIAALGAELNAYPDVMVLSDEIYEQFCYDSPAVSTGTISEDLARRTVTLDGISKTYGMTGWRIGYATGPQQVIDRATAAQFAILTCPPSVSQAAALGALTMDQTQIRTRNAGFVERRDAAIAILCRSSALDVPVPHGAFYLFPRIVAAGALGDTIVVDTLAERARVLVSAGTAFGAPGHFRLNFALDRAMVAEACIRVVATLDDLDREGFPR